MVKSQNTQWLSLKEASAVLGIHPSTLRRWADSGKIPCIRTAGGHRRFSRTALNQYLAQRDQPPAALSNTDLSQSLEQLTTETEATEERRMSRQWHAPFVQAEVIGRMRELGQRLLGLLIQYLTRLEEDERFLKEGREVGYRYGCESYAAHVDLLAAIEAFLFFRMDFLHTVSQMPATAKLTDGHESVRIYQRIDRFMNAVLLGLVTAYEEARGHLPPPSTSE